MHRYDAEPTEAPPASVAVTVLPLFVCAVVAVHDLLAVQLTVCDTQAEAHVDPACSEKTPLAHEYTALPVSGATESVREAVKPLSVTGAPATHVLPATIHERVWAEHCVAHALPACNESVPLLHE